MVYTNGGAKTFNQLDNLRLLPMQAHYNLDSLTNIIWFGKVAKLDGVYITIDTRTDYSFDVHFQYAVF